MLARRKERARTPLGAERLPGLLPPTRRRRRRFRSLTWRILALNVLALAFLVGGLLYIDQYQRTLIEAELDSLTVEAEIFAAAIGEAAVTSSPAEGQDFLSGLARPMVRRLAGPAKLRARLFADNGDLVADSRALTGPGGTVRIEELPPPQIGGSVSRLIAGVYEWVIEILPRRQRYPYYREKLQQRASDYEEALVALTGKAGRAVRAIPDAGLVLSVAVPVQRYKQVLGVLMLSKSNAAIEEKLRELRLDILKVFAIVLVITIGLSFYLAGTIARPVKRLADAAERVRHGQGRKVAIPDFSHRGDEIGDLSEALRDMTDALWQRMDAMEKFAADVAHEIKNPLTSVRSAIETVARVEEPEQQRRLMAIVLDDVDRLDRLISDISEASRLDAELSRAETETVDLGRMLETLRDVHLATSDEEGARLELRLSDQEKLQVSGIEGRLVQVFRNLVNNAISFSPPDGTITIGAWREGSFVRITVEDQGPGLIEGKLDAVFERFYSERPKGEKFGTHSGLGLSISKQIIEAHGGNIWAENIYDDGRIAGARFSIALPVEGEDTNMRGA
ncbi:MAG: stimulus-sensing domain-containing protein [Proteobacteria bacterium]|nr:stimulus-sensing domain-containing protein [Pseudomonadota bacterium]